jgi:hypothetical protein
MICDNPGLGAGRGLAPAGRALAQSGLVVREVKSGGLYATRRGRAVAIRHVTSLACRAEAPQA